MASIYYTDDVRGFVIGDVTFPYEFWLHENLCGQKVSRRIAHSHFVNDEEAKEWFRENYPAEYAHGVEMRVFDRV